MSSALNEIMLRRDFNLALYGAMGKGLGGAGTIIEQRGLCLANIISDGRVTLVRPVLVYPHSVLGEEILALALQRSRRRRLSRELVV